MTDVNSVLGRYCYTSFVRRIADVVSSGSSRVHLKAVMGQFAFQNAFC
jgi:hypothetical protein